MSLIANGAGEQPTGFYNGVATTSLRMDNASDPNLNITNSGAPTLNTKGTLSFWYKRGIQGSGTGQHQYLIHTGTGTADNTHMDLKIETGDALSIGAYGTTPFSNSRLLRDGSAWYHIVVAFDSTSGTASERLIKVYVNGVAQTGTFGAVAQNQQFPWINASQAIYIGRHASVNRPMDGYLAEWNLIDGQALAPTSFGETKNGVWIPIKYTGTYGDNGARLKFDQVGVGTASTSTIGADTSGNNNHWTSSGIVASDCAMPDSPENNFCTMNILTNADSLATSEGSLEWQGDTYSRSILGTFGMKSGKWYWETLMLAGGVSGNGYNAGIANHFVSQSTQDPRNGSITGGKVVISVDSRGDFNESQGSASNTSNSTTFAPADIIGIALDLDSSTQTIAFYKNNTIIGSARNLIVQDIEYFPEWDSRSFTNTPRIANFGQDDTFAGAISSAGNTDGNGIGVFKYAPPSGFLALCTANLPEPTISPDADTQADDHFNTVTYSGESVDGSTKAVTVGFRPDFIWGKALNRNQDHMLANSTVGFDVYLRTNGGAAEATLDSLVNDDVTATGFLFDDDEDGYFNFAPDSGDPNQMVVWNWKANGGTTTTNDASSTSVGTIDSVIQANTTAGFSIVTYTGFSGNNGTGAIAHGLGVAPSMIIHKSRTRTSGWWTQVPNILSHPNVMLDLSSTAVGLDLGGYGTMSVPDTSVFSINGVDGIGGESANYVAYCFAEVEGFSKVGSYTGNGVVDGPYVHLGFRPAFVLLKNTSTTDNWVMLDDTRLGDDVGVINPLLSYLAPNLNDVEFDSASYPMMDFLSNGFKLRLGGTGSTLSRDVNRAAGEIYMYIAFASSPFKYANAF